MKSLRIEAEFTGEVSLITFKDESGKNIYESGQVGEIVSNTFAKTGNVEEIHKCTELLREAAEKIMGEK